MARNVVARHRQRTDARAAVAQPVRVEAWLMRALVAAGVCYAVVQRQPLPALGGCVALCASFAPTLVSLGSRTRVPRLLDFVWVLGVTLAGVSTTFALYDRITYWGKLVHGLEGFLSVTCIAVLLLGYRDVQRLDLTDEMVGFVAILAGVAVGVGWEIIEFIVDWVAVTSLQKSNSDTMTDFLANDVCTVVAALLSVRLYCHAVGADDKQELGQIAAWLVDGPNRVLDRHGHLMVFVAAAIIAAAIAVLWFTGRPVPGLPTS
jgi:hypothetical protein